MTKLNYKPIAVQDECFGGTIKEPKIIVIIKTEAQGAKTKFYKNDVKEFNCWEDLNVFIEENSLKVLPEKEFRADIKTKTISLIKAMRQ
ncbi:MAG: hypothetical protein WC711_04295 [Candidatus Staskawiczbacteria bacterium]|jgi:hypothetical protein